MDTREFVCIACPIGCRLTVEQTEGGGIAVRGNRCPKGEIYGREETLAPKRTVTAVVRTDSPDFPCIPVRTDRPLPRERIFELLADLTRKTVRLPAACGDVLIENYRGSGVNVVITRTLPPAEPPSPSGIVYKGDRTSI